MHRALPVVAFVGLLIGWLVALFILALALNDALYFLAGRERWCGLAINAAFFFPVVLVAWSIRRRKIVLFATLGTFLVVVTASGLWIPFVAAFRGPPWAAKIVKGPPLSAATPYMWDAWAWSLPGGDDAAP